MADRERPVFVVGCARSGTTMMQLMLHAHPRIAVPPETRFVLQVYDRREDFGDLTRRENRKRLARYITRPRRSKLHDLGLDRRDVRRRIVRAEPTIGAAIEVVFQAYAERFGKPRWGDKRPAYIQRLETILALFPDAQIIHVIRDGRDCVASLKQMPWWRGDHVRATAYWNEAMGVGRRARRRLRADQYTEVRYEDLVAEPRTHLQRLCDFLGEDFDEAMLEPHRVADVGVPDRKTWHASTRREVSDAAVERFLRDLEPHELGLVELVARRSLRRQGYAPVVPLPRPRARDLLRYIVHDLRRRLSRLRRLVGRWRVDRRHQEPVTPPSVAPSVRRDEEPALRR